MRFFGLTIRTYPKDRTLQFLRTEDRAELRAQLRDAIDRGGFQRLVVFSAGLGFLAGAYEIFATSLTTPMIKIVYYYPHEMPSGTETLLRAAILLGAIVGQVSFGFLADLYGRRKLYGIELYIIIIAIVGTLMSSAGQDDSLNIFNGLFTWRFIMGIGIGADYPLSATIVAEFAPTQYRARMIAWVFYMQPLGYVFAALITLAVTRQYESSIPTDVANAVCDVSCVQAIDRSWRIIIGIGGIPAVIALFFRRTIPEAPLYTADVINQPIGALQDFQRLEDGSSISDLELNHTEPTPVNLQAPAYDPVIPLLELNPANEDDAQDFGHRWKTYWTSFHTHFFEKGHWRSLLGVSGSWFCLDASFYALGSSSSTVVTRLFNAIPLGTNFECTTLQNCTVTDPGATDPSAQSLYGGLFANAWRSLLVVCAGSIVGGAIMIALIKSHSPKHMQMGGFLFLIPIFLATGLICIFQSGITVTYSTTILYFIAQVFFEVGPNFTTFMLPSEIFPTRHRAFAHGIAAASGKLGASAFQAFFQFVNFQYGGQTYNSQSAGTKWLGFTILCFMPIMLVGALVTFVLVPQTRIENGRTNQPMDVLEQLGSESVWGRSRVTVFLMWFLGPVFWVLGVIFFYVGSFFKDCWWLLSCGPCKRKRTDSSETTVVDNSGDETFH